jgi:DNA polymerase III subunit epsilon
VNEQRSGSGPTHRLFRAVREAGGRIDPSRAARSLLRLHGAPSTAARQVVLSLAHGDPRLRVDDDGTVALEPPVQDDTPLDRVDFVVVDVETTGSCPLQDRITELGAVRTRGGRVRASFERLVDPQRPVPTPITWLTGIDAALLSGAPTFERIAADWLGFLANGVLVAHNARFDSCFLNRELRQCGEGEIPNPILCTVRLSRRLLPDLRAYHLDALARHLGLHFRQRHRALGDAEVTAALLLQLLERAADRGLRSLGDLREIHRRRIPRPRPSPGQGGS